MGKSWILQFASYTMQAAGKMLEAQDTNTTGTDDVVGEILDLGGAALGQFSTGNIKGVNGYLKLIADAITAYLANVQPAQIASKAELGRQ